MKQPWEKQSTLEKQQEKKSLPPLKTAIYQPEKGHDALSLSMAKIFSLFDLGTNMPIIKDQKDLLEKLEKEKFDILLFSDITPDALRQVIKIRNTPNLKQQPVIMALDISRYNLQKALDAGVDIALNVTAFIPTLLEGITSVPKLITNIEDTYGEKALINKQHFYKEYKDKLSRRSEVTADTPKEIKILDKIFQKYNSRKILDAGGGEGRIAIPLSEKGYQITNLDSSADLIEKMNSQTDKVKGVIGDLKKIPLKDKIFDAITYNWHVFCDILGNKAKNQVLSEAHRVLKNEGLIVLDIPDRTYGAEKRDGVYIDYPGGEAIFIGYVPSEEEMLKHLENAGFKEIKVKKWETKKGFHKLTFIAKK